MRRIYRRVCVLRATGHADEAGALEHTDLARALAAARLASEDPTLEHTVLAEEAERIASAEALADLLAPLLAERLRSELRPLLARPAAPASAETTGAPTAPARNAAGGDAPPIADLIDSMLAQQGPRPRAGERGHR